MSILRVFPRRTAATPRDSLAVVGYPSLFLPDDIETVHVSVTFTWDLPEAQRLAAAWGAFAPVSIGGPATEMAGGDFEAGQYLAPGYVITSRGCPNRCWFCSVWRREGDTARELPIVEGWNILDDNLLACSDAHVLSVCDMLKRQRMGRPQFTGGIEAARVQQWHAEALRDVRPSALFCAYDTPDDAEPLAEAGRIFASVGLSGGHVLRCYVLCGWPSDTLTDAERRMRFAFACGFLPMAMCYRDRDGRRPAEWVPFCRQWTRPQIVGRLCR